MTTSQETTALPEAFARIEAFRAGSLRTTIAALESKLAGIPKKNASATLDSIGISGDLLLAALLIKKSSSQISEILHAVGILLALPALLEEDEVLESLSLAAGNTGKGFDLETDRRIAEFTFIQWQGGPEVIRQNKIFKDFYFLAEADTKKRRELYTIGTSYPVKFFCSERKIAAILGGNAKLGKSFREKYGITYTRVCDYYLPRQEVVAIRDICEHVPYLQSEKEA